ncbi:late embryogenesis abundant protein D-34-like [Lycium ferocissimum]|uniref:late embryogenesis abundant protein D-34-like n=1 Tax=Lycium ferocissimum TaxID=112874 RepID=UPI00281655CC|nr:late embryogenesis abundant protein D-34-like [Lycium ferocissimum]
MSQGQPQRPETEHQQEPIKFGDVFNVTGELADQPIAPQDAAMMQSAESMVFGQTQKGGPASVMQAAATKNERTGLVSHEASTQVAGDEGVTVAETKVPGRRIITESVAGQVLGQYVEAVPVIAAAVGGIDVEEAPITIGEALAATAHTAGEKPVEQSDAAAIQAAEVRATGSSVIIPGGLAATAQSAASGNEVLAQDVDKIKLNDVLTGATAKLPADKAATRQDAEGVMEAELRNNPSLTTYPGGVAASVAAAARLNESSS